MHQHHEGRLTARDCKRYIRHEFTAPELARLEIDFRFSPERVHDIRNLLTLTLFDPHGFRGAGHRGGAHHHVSIDTAAATPGYLPGRLPAGRWVVEIDTHMIMPGDPVAYTLDVTAIERAGEDGVAPDREPPVRGPAKGPARGPGWYRGDLHTHTDHSDADDFPVAALLATAGQAGFDFVFLTDHNTISGLAEMDAASSETLLTAGGMELTTYWGHALCLGTRDWVDWRAGPGTGELPRTAAELYARGQVFVIAHPGSDGDPGCTGCTWRVPEMYPGNARVVEVWNGPWRGDSGNEEALALWYDWLNEGLRLVASAGSDYHGDVDELLPEAGPGSEADDGTDEVDVVAVAAAANVGFSVIYAEALTEAALLKALMAGHLYLSAGPQVSFEARAAGTVSMMGDEVPASAAEEGITLAVTWDHCAADAQVRTIVNGRLLDAWPAEGRGTREWTMQVDEADWVVVEIRDARGAMLALTNPIFLPAPVR